MEESTNVTTEKATLVLDTQAVAIAQMETGAIYKAREDLVICATVSILFVIAIALCEGVGYLIARFGLHRDFSDKEEYVACFFLGLVILAGSALIVVILYQLISRLIIACQPLPVIPPVAEPTAGVDV